MRYVFSMIFLAFALLSAAQAADQVPFYTVDQIKVKDPALYKLITATSAPATYLAATPAGWNSSAVCGKTLSTWNMYYGCGLHSNSTPMSGTIATLTIGATFSKGNLYPVEMQIHVINSAGATVGILYPGYFAATPSNRVINISSYNFPLDSSFRYYFRINGGGSPTVTSPPTVISTYISPSA